MVRGMSLAVTLALGFVVSTPALAARADRRQVKQEARIVQGVKSGELSGREAVRLQAQHDALQREIARDRADDGKLDPVERARIERQQDRLSKRIATQKHDAQKR
ncbi:hypothetical protein [Vitiosangium sp. GDMCC 1.1324]|uniref:hypothetical protein n=1 Tax=Vitiosangium sp. (strain GDMCC 1.1324) TaxID=2138576 RepID=UPI000D33BEBB|nr:hypothetical protein [Vitiosangium sp. GDMCC 1.1324]PTL79691.1 hypothetical protein DAT35_33355 [Vitiosangium sp. GDMCC 1.1324]